MDEDPYEVAIQVVILPGAEVGTEAEIEAAVNEITLPAINCTVDIQYVSIADVANTTSLGVAGGEKLDIVHVATVSPLSSMVGSELLYDMNEGNLIENRGSELVELLGDYIDAGEVNGQQLAIPAVTYYAQQCGFYYNKTLADAAGITIPESLSFSEVGTYLEQIHEAYPDIIPYYVGEGITNLLPWIMNTEKMGTNYCYGGILDPLNDATIENIYASDTFKDYCLQMFEWRQEGLLQKDSTDSTSAQDYFNSQQMFMNLDVYTPTEMATVASSAAQSGFEVGFCALDDAAITNGTVSEYMWGIASNSERPDKAMDFLNYLYTDAEVANLIMYGIEGTDYTFEDGSDTVVARTGSYLPSFYRAGNVKEMYIESPNDEDFITEMDELEESASKSNVIGYIFDDSAFQTESAVISNVINEYLPALQNGMYDSEEDVLTAIDEFNAALEAAGINDVIADNQTQLDAYLSSK